MHFIIRRCRSCARDHYGLSASRKPGRRKSFCRHHRCDNEACAGECRWVMGSQGLTRVAAQAGWTIPWMYLPKQEPRGKTPARPRLPVRKGVAKHLEVRLDRSSFDSAIPTRRFIPVRRPFHKANGANRSRKPFRKQVVAVSHDSRFRRFRCN